MKSERRKPRLGMLMMAAWASFLVACAMDVERDQKPGTEQNELTADKVTPDESTASEQAVSASDAEPATASEADSVNDAVVRPRVSCRRVVVSSIPVFTTPSGSTVLCRFFLGDVFSHFGFVSPPGRYITWCPRGVPPAQGTTGYAQASGTVDGGCG
jgi:hypothetical protein